MKKIAFSNQELIDAALESKTITESEAYALGLLPDSESLLEQLREKSKSVRMGSYHVDPDSNVADITARAYQKQNPGTSYVEAACKVGCGCYYQI